MHQYLDSDGSGTSATCVSSTIGAERIAAATAWLRANNKKGFLGEVGAGSNDACIAAVKGALCAMQQSGVWIGALWWAAVSIHFPWTSLFRCRARNADEFRRDLGGARKFLPTPSHTITSLRQCRMLTVHIATSRGSSPQMVWLSPEFYQRHSTPLCKEAAQLEIRGLGIGLCQFGTGNVVDVLCITGKTWNSINRRTLILRLLCKLRAKISDGIDRLIDAYC